MKLRDLMKVLDKVGEITIAICTKAATIETIKMNAFDLNVLVENSSLGDYLVHYVSVQPIEAGTMFSTLRIGVFEV